MTDHSKEAAAKEVENLRHWRKTVSDAVRCDWCNGSGRQYLALHGDSALGHSDAGKCTWCNCTGKDKAKVFIS